MPKEYLGDGVYVDFDGYSLTLTAEDGIRATNTIVLETPVYSALVQYVEGMKIARLQELASIKNRTCTICGRKEGPRHSLVGIDHPFTPAQEI